MEQLFFGVNNVNLTCDKFNKRIIRGQKENYRQLGSMKQAHGYLRIRL